MTDVDAPKHTPGPWSVHVPKLAGGSLGDYGDRGIRAGAMTIGEVWEHCPSSTNPVGIRVDADANARLICAAPTLLNACRLALTRMDDGTQISANIAGHLIAAITEATGQAPQGIPDTGSYTDYEIGSGEPVTTRAERAAKARPTHQGERQ